MGHQDARLRLQQDMEATLARKVAELARENNTTPETVLGFAKKLLSATLEEHQRLIAEGAIYVKK